MDFVIGAGRQVEPSSELIYTASYRITAHTGPVNMWETVIIAFSWDDDKWCLHNTYHLHSFQMQPPQLFDSNGVFKQQIVCKN